ncbi:MAG: uroporphyrinogen-III C-methyltransferase [Deltaproteobacteria bacterium]|nr:uroporphyrinogen-III C-methyltransferase [Deltaproteobacteria bacterium]
MATGLVALVGVGPGDPGLLTLRAVKALSLADCVVYDALVHPRVLLHARPEAERLFVGKRRGVDSATQDEINHLLLYRARQGLRVARLKGGDPYLFGRGAEEALFLAHHGVPFEVVPGVTSALGAAAYAGLALSHRELSSRVTFLTGTGQHGEDVSLQGLGTEGTLVLYMGMHHLERTLEGLVARGWAPETPAAAVQWATWARQRTVSGTLSTLSLRCAEESLGTPALVVLGSVVSLRQSLRWWDRGPLQGRTVLVTRARDQADALVEGLLDRGAEPLELPLLAFEAPSSPDAVERALDALSAGSYGLVAFTSANGVGWFFRALRHRGLDARGLRGALVACVGQGTASALQTHGIIADLVAREARAEGLLAALAGWDRVKLQGLSVLLPRAEVAAEALAGGLVALGALADSVAFYRTVRDPSADPTELRQRLAEGTLDAVTFTSGSTVDALCDLLGDAPESLRRTAVAVLGPVTAKAARARGLEVAVQAPEATVESLLDALGAHFKNPLP